MAIMTSKGYAVRAAKQLLARATTKEITILCAHDCDIYGFEIARTLAEETRTSKGLTVKVIDLGLQVADALTWDWNPKSYQKLKDTGSTDYTA